MSTWQNLYSYSRQAHKFTELLSSLRKILETQIHVFLMSPAS